MYYENPKGVAVHEGFPNAGTDVSIQTLDLNKLLIKNTVSTYFMRMHGNSAHTYGIARGDILVIDRALSPQPNDLVIWWQGEEFKVSPQHRVPLDHAVWGVVSATVRQLRGGTQ